MTIQIQSFVLGPLENNAYLLQDTETHQAALIDPPFGSKTVWQYCQQENLRITNIFCTHAHFDHIAGLLELQTEWDETPNIWLHQDDLPLWRAKGGATNFGIPFDLKLEPSHWFTDQQLVNFGNNSLRIFHTPGHTPGHVVLYLHTHQLAFVGDLIFRLSVGRTDLPGGSHIQLLASIDRSIKPLPGETRLLSGHGPETTVEYEKKHNPYL